MRSSEITSKAKSNLALALKLLPKERRDDMVVYYAYCRVIDDIADDETVAVQQRKTALLVWREGVLAGFADPNDFQREVADLQTKHGIPGELMAALIDGCLMDTEVQRFGTWEELQQYSWKVASSVGLVSLKLLGASNPASESYAVQLGQALQLTNILRDIDEDLRNGSRIYLPLDDFARFQYSEHDLIRRVDDSRFQAMMSFQADRAETLFRQAAESLPEDDRKSLTAAEVMREIYQTLLRQMRSDEFRVFEKRYSLPAWKKMAILAKHMIP